MSWHKTDCPECRGTGTVFHHWCDMGCVSRGWCPPDEVVEADCPYCNAEDEK
ncbi:MAG: hypothetical protein ACW987_20810 [Candidatus Thorarchaeota archaeon]|jgi:hypothetical protein